MYWAVGCVVYSRVHWIEHAITQVSLEAFNRKALPPFLIFLLATSSFRTSGLLGFRTGFLCFLLNIRLTFSWSAVPPCIAIAACTIQLSHVNSENVISCFHNKLSQNCLDTWNSIFSNNISSQETNVGRHLWSYIAVTVVMTMLTTHYERLT